MPTMECFAVWPDDPDATGPFYSRSGHLDVFVTEQQAQAFMRRWCSSPAEVVRVTVTRGITRVASGRARPAARKADAKPAPRRRSK